MFQKWFAKFHAGDFSLDDAPWSGRPVEVDSNQIETLIESNQRHTTWEITNILKISKSIKLLMKMKNVYYFMEKTKWTFWLTQCKIELVLRIFSEQEMKRTGAIRLRANIRGWCCFRVQWPVVSAVATRSPCHAHRSAQIPISEVTSIGSV